MASQGEQNQKPRPKAKSQRGKAQSQAREEKSRSRAWEALTPPLTEWILDAVRDMGLERMTPVQASTIPLFMGNKDVVVEVCNATLIASVTRREKSYGRWV